MLVIVQRIKRLGGKCGYTMGIMLEFRHTVKPGF
jgi:hypothetical protein